MDKDLNSYSEIKRLCRLLDTSAENSFDLSINIAVKQGGIFHIVQTGSNREDFNICCNGDYYLIQDGKFNYLYKKR